jgi:hypothetical protein
MLISFFFDLNKKSVLEGTDLIGYLIFVIFGLNSDREAVGCSNCLIIYFSWCPFWG